MRFKLDENLPASLAADLAVLGHDVDTAVDEGLGGNEDDDVWAATQAAGRILITQDLDFSDVRTFAPGTHHGLILLRMREPGRVAMRTRVLAVFRSEAVAEWGRCVVVIGDNKIRVRTPPANA
jgi:predicted nuclease of predicted toxin-antitoxin system